MSRGSAYGLIRHPYPGLRPFRETEQAIFFGRDSQIAEVLRRLRESQFAAIVGGSGSGKSSLVRAGIIPELRAKGLSDSGDFWLIADFTPKDQAFDSLAKAVAPLFERGKQTPDEHLRSIRQAILECNNIGAFFEANRDRIVLEEGQPKEARSMANLLIICDQFEEIFRNWQDPAARHQADLLVDLLVGAYEGRKRFPRLFVIVGMRSDDLHRTTNYIKLPTVINASSYLTRRLDTEEVAAAIIEPIRFLVRNLFRENNLRPPVFRPIAIDSAPFDPEVMRRLYDEVANFSYDPDHLPLLQHLLSVLWEKVKGRFLESSKSPSTTTDYGVKVSVEDLRDALGFASVAEMDKYASSGGGKLLGRALDREADRAWNADPGAKGAAEFMFKLLASVDSRGSYKRRWTTRKEICEVAGTTSDRVNAVIKSFTVPFPFLNVAGTGDNDKIDVSHESFIRKWSRFGSWLKAEHELATAFVNLKSGYDEWVNNVRDSSTFRRYLKFLFGRLGDDDIADLYVWRKERRWNEAWSRRYQHGTDEDQESPLHADQLPKAAVPLAALRSYYWRSWLQSKATRWSPLGIPVLLLASWFLGLYLWLGSNNQDAYRIYALTNQIISPAYKQDENSKYRLWEAAMNLEALDAIEDNWRNPRLTLGFAHGREFFGRMLDVVPFDGYELASEAADRAARLKSSTLIWPATGAKWSPFTPDTSWPSSCDGNQWKRFATKLQAQSQTAETFIQDFAKSEAPPIHKTAAPGERQDGAQIALFRSGPNSNFYAFFAISKACELGLIASFSIAPGSEIKFDEKLTVLLYNTKVQGESGLQDDSYISRARFVRQCVTLHDEECESPTFVWDPDARPLEVPVGAPYKVSKEGLLVDAAQTPWAIDWIDKPRMLTGEEVKALPVGLRNPSASSNQCVENDQYRATKNQYMAIVKPELTMFQQNPNEKSSQYKLEVFQQKYGDAFECHADPAKSGVKLLSMSFLSSRPRGIQFGSDDASDGYLFVHGDEKRVIYKIAWTRKLLLKDLCTALGRWFEGKAPASAQAPSYLPDADKNRYADELVKRAREMDSILAPIPRCQGFASPALAAGEADRKH